MSEVATKEPLQQLSKAEIGAGPKLPVRKLRPDKESEPRRPQLYLEIYARYSFSSMGDEEEERLAHKWVSEKSTAAQDYGISIEELNYGGGADIPSEDLGPDLSTTDILDLLSDSNTSDETRRRLICTTELIKFSDAERDKLLNVLWHHILNYRDSDDHGELVAVGAAIRKYVATMPMDSMAHLAELLKPGHHAALPHELELEVVKMIYRNFEVHPPEKQDPFPDLSTELWEMAQIYSDPRLLIRDKAPYPSIASLAIEALIAMRSSYAQGALRLARRSSYSWFKEIVDAHLDKLRDRWTDQHKWAATWLDSLRKNVKQGP